MSKSHREDSLLLNIGDEYEEGSGSGSGSDSCVQDSVDEDSQDSNREADGNKHGRSRPKRRVSEDEEADSDEDNKDKDPKASSLTEVLSKSFAIIKTLLKFLFSTATSTDTFILLIGSVFSIIHGITFPFVAVLFGSMTNSFIQQSVSGYANETRRFYNDTEESFNITGDEILDKSQNLGTLVPPQVGSVFDLINQVVLQTFTKHEALTKEEFLENVHIAGILFLWLAILILVSSFFQVLCWEWVAANQQFQLRESIVRRTLRQDMWWFQKHDIGELIADIFGQVGRVRDALGFRFSSVVESCAMFVMSSLIAISISWRLALVFLSPIPFIVFKMLTLGRRIASSSQKGDEIWTSAESLAAQFLSNVDTVIACNKQLDAVEKFGSKLESAVDEPFKKCHLAALGRGMLALFMYVSYAVAFWYACHLLKQGQISAGEIYTIFLAITMGSVGITNIMNSVTVIGTAYGSAVHLSEFGHPLPKLDCFSQKGKCRELEGEVEFVKATFAYPGGRKVLDNLSFKIEAGKTVAILADAGEGKTTIANLILRVYYPTRGKVKIDGVNAQKLNLKTLRRYVGIVLQHSLLSDFSIDDNIRAARAFLSKEDIQDARYLVDAKRQLPEDEDARQFTKHDRHKINISRGIASRPAILVLDEAFTYLQSPEKEDIRAAVLQSRRGMTNIILTYDILSLESKDIDKIYILKDGRILPANIGTHQELMQTGGEGNIYNTMRHTATVLSAIAKKGEGMGPIHLGTNIGFGSTFGRMWNPPEPKPEGVIELFGLSSTFAMFGFGTLGVVLTGVQLSVFAYYFVEMFGTFSKTGDELEYDGKFWAGMIGLIAIVAAVSIWIRTLYMSVAGLYTMLNIRTTAFGSIIRRPKSYYHKAEPKTSPIALGTKVVHHTPLIKTVLEDHLPQGLSTAVTLICIGVIVTVLVWQIGLILIFGVYTFLALLAILQYKIQRTGENKFCEADAKTSDLVTTGMDLMELIQTHSMQAHYFKKYPEAVKTAWREAHEQACVFGFLFGLSEAIFFVFFGVSLIYGCYLINIDAIQPEKLFKIFFSMAFCVVSFNEILAMMPDLAKAVCSLGVISDLVREEDKLEATMDALNDIGQAVSDGKGKLEFCGVDFEYTLERQVFKGLDLKIPAMKTTTITGPPFFGGTTLLALILRFYDPKFGQINLDDKDIGDFKIAQLRDKIAWVPEQISFFDGSLAHNVKFGSEHEVSLKEVKDVLTKVKLMDTLGKGLNARRERKDWKTLSRGKQVLIGIARALMRDAKILLLDSPTSSMSPEEEMKIVDVIREIKKGRTCVIISDSAVVLELGDQIAVIQDGVVVEGPETPDKIKAKGGYYFTKFVGTS